MSKDEKPRTWTIDLGDDPEIFLRASLKVNPDFWASLPKGKVTVRLAKQHKTK